MPTMCKKERIQQYFDQHAGVYDSKHGLACAGQKYNFLCYYEPFLRHWIPTGARVLELGCGTGAYTRWLVDHGCEVCGMDISANILEKARQRCREARLFKGDCEDPASCLPLDLREGGFDAIVGVNTFSYYPHKLAALRRYKKLLRPGGRIVLLDMNGNCPFYRLMALMNKNEIQTWYTEVRSFNARKVSEMIRNAGMRLRKQMHFAFVPNGVSRSSLALLRPIDALLNTVPLLRPFSMRLAVAADCE